MNLRAFFPSDQPGAPLPKTKAGWFLRRLLNPGEKIYWRWDFVVADTNMKVGWVFLSLGLLLPVILDLISSATSGTDAKSVLPILFAIIKLAAWIFSLIWITRRISWSQLLRTGGWAFYLYDIILSAISIILLPIITAIAFRNIDPEDLSTNFTYVLISTIIQVVAQWITIGLVVAYSPIIRQGIIKTIKKNWPVLIIVTLVMIGLIFVLNEYVFGQITKAIISPDSSSDSKNQASLNTLFGHTGGIVALVIFSVITAPILEELTYRQSPYALISNKWIAFAFISIYFAEMHVAGSGLTNWAYFFSYIGGSMVLTSGFIYTDGLILYNILAHAGWNLIAFALAAASQ